VLGRSKVETAWFFSIRPFPWRGIASRMRPLFSNAKAVTEFLPWIAPEFAKRMAVEARWKEFSSLSFPADPHPSRPVAHASLMFREWARMFEMNDPGVTRVPVEVAYPFLDLNLVEYLLAIPVFPWAFKKTLERKAMRGKLPDEILGRKKTPVPKDARTNKSLEKATDRLRSGRPLEGKILDYVSPVKLSNNCDRTEGEEVRPYCPDQWLRGIG
jgi:asparagine synthase (glutamine-hydrolysing)